jgi:leucyl aminopeptidase
MFESVTIAARPAAGSILLVGHFQGQAPDRKTLGLDPSGELARAAKRADATGESGRIVEVPGRRRTLLVGLGKKESFTPNSLRNIAAAVARKLAVTKDEHLEVDLSGPLAETRVDAGRAGIAFGEGVGLVGWVCDQFRGTATTPKPRSPLAVSSATAAFRDGLTRGVALAQSANLTRTLSETPPNIATPDYMAAQCTKLARKTGMKCRVIRGQALEKERLTGLINVGQASENKPCLIRLEYTPKRRKRGARPVVIVGKTITYDTGGLSLKINNGMRGMKRDKDGGCAVIGAMHAIATEILPDRPVIALLAAAENSLSDNAYRPDDIITYRNGVTVEVTNTDAEGRLVLADALCWACELEDPEYIIDLATLTGGVVTALGSTYAGLWCEDDRLRRKVEEAAGACDERVWRLPHHQEYNDMMKSSVADIVNSNPNRKAHPIQGAAFLSYFVKKGIPWCHLDIAGVHAVEGTYGPFQEGPTGWGVRLLANLLD